MKARMKKNRTAKAVYTLTLLFVSVLAQPGLSHAATRVLGENLLGEACESRDRDDMVTISGLDADARLFCADREVGSVAHLPMAAAPEGANAQARLDLVRQALSSSAIQKAIDARMTCKPPTVLGEASETVVLACQLKSGGWQHLVVVSAKGNQIKIAEAPPTSAVLLFRLAGLPQDQAKTMSTRDKLSSFWGEPVVLASASDLVSFNNLIQQGAQANAASNFVQAEDAYRKALALQTRFLSENDLAVANTLMDLAVIVSNQGRYDEAQALFRRAEPIIQKSPADSDRARFDYYQGLEAANRGDYFAAVAFAAKSVSQWRKVVTQDGTQGLLGGNSEVNSAQSELALALNFQAAMALRNEDFVTAGVLASEALLLINKIEGAPEVWRADVMATLGEISITQGRLSAAETYFTNAMAIRKQLFGEGTATWPLQAALGKAYQRESMSTSAIITFRQMFNSIAARPAIKPVLSADQLVPFAAALVDYSATLTSEDDKQGLFAEAFPAFQMTRSGVVNQTIQKAQARLSTNDPEISALIEQVQTKQRLVDGLRVDLALEQALPDVERSAEVESRLQQQLKTQRNELAVANRALRARFPEYSSLVNPKPLSLLEVRRSLADHEGVLSFLIGSKESFVQLTKRNSNHVARIRAGEAELYETVKSLRGALEIQGGSVNEFDMQKSHLLYQTLLKALEPQLQDIKHLIVAPSGPLASLPFGLLVTQPPPSNNQYSRASWLVNQASISHVPSVQALYTLRATKRTRLPAQALLAFADPVLDGPSAKPMKTDTVCVANGPMNVNTLRALAPLPETSSEVRSVANTLGRSKSTLFFRDKATEENVRAQALDDYRVLYFATHGLLPGELRCQAEPGLVMSPPRQQVATTQTDGLLAASEIAQLKLNADMVVLSACNTAGGGGKFGGEALSGLAESFFFAGARGLVVSHWQVPSSATAALLSNMFETLGPELQGGAAPALRNSQLRMIAGNTTSHPFFWAAFVVVGDGLAGAQSPALTTALSIEVAR